MKVYTENSVYDISDGFLTRTTDFNELRKDGEQIKILGWITEPKVGYNMEVILDIRGDGVSTFRRSTRVTRIEITGEWQ